MTWPDFAKQVLLTQTYLSIGRCPDIDCGSGTGGSSARGRALQDPQADALLQPTDDGALMASYSVFVLEPGEQVGES